jgi:hypothetical protein
MLTYFSVLYDLQKSKDYTRQIYTKINIPYNNFLFKSPITDFMEICWEVSEMKYTETQSQYSHFLQGIYNSIKRCSTSSLQLLRISALLQHLNICNCYHICAKPDHVLCHFSQTQTLMGYLCKIHLMLHGKGKVKVHPRTGHEDTDV